ncbi:hypothetical protein [Siminovitchia fordii]|uniref:Uncharacterized protein n=1 Tax=Siminovitchia fordii TaxID=254759 RepID=A0ABQ4KC84_9BACI|nr:hypothetical protein [Siminovitchia fordii]GIN22641.1 hypothetical protein J1TS3_37750 [Siminovitchia fordii]
MIIKINGVSIDDNFSSLESAYDYFDIKPYLPKSRKEATKLRKLSIWMWSLSGTFLVKSNVLAAGSESMWAQMQPLWSVFQDIALVLGCISLFTGLIIYYFKRGLGKSVIMSSILVVGGCFLVPSALMLIAIIGSMMNDVLMNVFQNLDLKDSVKVGG